MNIRPPETMPSILLRLLVVSLLLFNLATDDAVSAVEDDEVESMLNVLRARGYNLFSNAIATSDLIYDVLTGNSFTFFAPTDSSLFILDMSSTASDYVRTLRCHVIPLLVPFPELRLFNSGTSLPTLAKDHQATVRVDRSSSGNSSDDVITVDGVGVVFPGLFSGRSTAVHGLRGILNCTSDQQLQTPKANSQSPVKKHSSAYPPRSISYPQIDSQRVDIKNPKESSPSPANPPDDYRFNSPAATETPARISPSNFFNQIEPPSSGDVYDRSITPPEPEYEFFPPNLPDSVHFPPQVSPAYDLWPEFPTSPYFAPSSEPGPPPEFSENDDPMEFPPSSTDAVENQQFHMVATDSELNSLDETKPSLINEDERRSAVSDYTPVTWVHNMAGIMRKEQEKSQPLDEDTFDCPMTDDSDPSSFPHGYAYTREPPFCSSS